MNDRTIITETCWSEHPIRLRIWSYGQYITDNNYNVHPDNIESYKKIVELLEQNQNDPKKNNCMIITGQPGSGKTTLTKIIAKVTYPLNHSRRYKFASAQDICNDFASQGHKALKKYSIGHWIFDDVGREDKTGIDKSYKTYNVMDKVLDEIHKNVLSGQASFILSTNDNKEMLSVKYSPQVISRLNQICEYIPISHKDYRESKRIISCYPEVLHLVKSSTQLELTPEEKEAGRKKKEEILAELVQKFNITERNEPRNKNKFLKPTSFEEAVDQWFGDQWLKQGNKTREGNNEPVIIYEEKEYNRGEFTVMCRTLTPQ